MENITLNIEGMTCSNCVLNVQKAAEKTGAHDVNVDLGLAELNASIKSMKEVPFLIDEIEKAGYKASQASNSKTVKRPISRLEVYLAISAMCSFPLLLSMLFPKTAILNNAFFQLILSIPVIYISIIHFGKSAFYSLKNGIPNMDVLIFVGSTAAFIYSLIGTLTYYKTELVSNFLFYETATTIVTLVLVGNLIEQKSIQNTSKHLKSLIESEPTKAKRLKKDRTIEEIETNDISIEDELIVNLGDKIPVDGIISIGQGVVNESILTGESIPIDKAKGAKVISGSLLDDGHLMIKATKTYQDSTYAKLINLMKQAQFKKPSIQKLSDKVSAIFVPIVILISLLTFSYWYWMDQSPLLTSLMSAISVLVISCPCAMGLATPTAVMVGFGASAKKGILYKSGEIIEKVNAIKTLVFDKTGTLTTGKFEIQNIESFGVEKQELKNLIYSLEQFSNHPIAKSIVSNLKADSLKLDFQKVEEIKGVGVKGFYNNDDYFIGKAKKSDSSLLELIVLKNEKTIGKITLKDTVKKDAKSTIKKLHKYGYDSILLSGDKESISENIALETGIKKHYSEKNPQEKLEIIESLSKVNPVAMIGDGVNDAPSLARADVGISLNSATELTSDSADIILMDKENTASIFLAFQSAKSIHNTIKQNLFWAFAYNLIAIPIACMGLLNPMVAAFSMAFSDIIVIGNSLRLKQRINSIE